MTGYRTRLVAAALGLAFLGMQEEATAQTSDFYVGQLQQFATSWCPNGWLRADGSVYPIAQNTLLFSLIGARFGGDGRTTFAVPNLVDRAPTGTGPATPVGTASGQSAITVGLAELPSHSHGFNADPTPPVSNSPANSMMGVYPAGAAVYAPVTAPPNAPMNPGVVVPTGGSQPLPTQMPVLATNWCIAASGVYPAQP